MSVSAIRRSFLVVHHLKTHGEARFTDFAHLLAPISRTALSHLLASLVEIGELERTERLYRLGPNAAALAGSEHTVYALPPALRAQTHEVLEKTALEVMHSCALFARVGTSTMKIMDEHNLAQPHWPFTPVGYEWPLVPFHGFARVFLAHAPQSVARDCYVRWFPYLRPNVRTPTYKQFRTELDKIRRQQYAIEYRDELSTIMRVVVPVTLPDDTELRFAVGLVANYVYLLQVKNCLGHLRAAAEKLSALLAGKVPQFHFDEQVPVEGEQAWEVRGTPELKSGAAR